MASDQITRNHLVTLLQGRIAHLTFEDAVADFPMNQINTRPPNVPYTPWHLIEHLRIAQWDILEYIQNPQHVSPKWPEGYWPSPDAETDAAGWENTLKGFRDDLQALVELVQNPATDLYAPIPHDNHGHTILREVFSVADHNAYHVGELAILRQVMDNWPK
ncbi:MAG: DinB family protein [Anaerolineaceae bacterium]|nr:DinB family protein [Anaerolineaceae bacterium]